MNAIQTAVRSLRAGNPVVLPTDTVYGIGALPHIEGAVKAVFDAKGRPDDKPLPVLAASAADLARVVVMDAKALRLGEHFWPGPLTLVLPRRPDFGYDLGPGEATVAVRIPASEMALELLNASGPLAVTSANRSGESPATTVAEARAALGGHVDVFLDGGPCTGEPSTVVSLEGEAKLLRAGALPFKEVSDVLASLR